MVVDAEGTIASALSAGAPALVALAGHTQGFTVYPPGRSASKPHRRCSCLLLCPPSCAGGHIHRPFPV